MDLIQNYGDKMAQAFAVGLDVDFRGARAALVAGIEDLILLEQTRSASQAFPEHYAGDTTNIDQRIADLRRKIGLTP
jgi:hypothetical protein